MVVPRLVGEMGLLWMEDSIRGPPREDLLNNDLKALGFADLIRYMVFFINKSLWLLE